MSAQAANSFGGGVYIFHGGSTGIAAKTCSAEAYTAADATLLGNDDSDMTTLTP